MATKQVGRSEAELMGLIQPLLLEGETVAYVADGNYAGLEAHDSLTIFVMRLTGKWKDHPFVIAVSDKRFRWIELDGTGKVSKHADYKLPLKGRLVMQGKGVIEFFLPGEPRRFLTFSRSDKARALFDLIDDQQKEVTRKHAHLPEVVGPGMKPAQTGEAFTKGEHGQTLVTQHENIGQIRPSFRPEKVAH